MRIAKSGIMTRNRVADIGRNFMRGIYALLYARASRRERDKRNFAERK